MHERGERVEHQIYTFLLHQSADHANQRCVFILRQTEFFLQCQLVGSLVTWLAQGKRFADKRVTRRIPFCIVDAVQNPGQQGGAMAQ